MKIWHIVQHAAPSIVDNVLMMDLAKDFRSSRLERSTSTGHDLVELCIHKSQWLLKDHEEKSQA